MSFLFGYKLLGYKNKYKIPQKAIKLARDSGNSSDKTYEDTVNTVLDVFYADLENTTCDNYYMYNSSLPNVKFWISNKWYAITMHVEDTKYKISTENLARVIQLVYIIEERDLNKRLNIESAAMMMIAGTPIPTEIVIESIKKTHPQYLV